MHLRFVKHADQLVFLSPVSYKVSIFVVLGRFCISIFVRSGCFRRQKIKEFFWHFVRPIFESSGIGNVDNCLVNDNNGDTASSENGEAVDIITDDVNSDSNNIVSGQASNSSVANHSTASMNDNSTNNNISCDISHTSNVNSSKDDNNVSSNSNSSDAINNCSDNSNNDTSCAASCSGVNNDISSGHIISNCLVSDNTTDITGNGNDIGNSNSSNVNTCKNDKYCS